MAFLACLSLLAPDEEEPDDKLDEANSPALWPLALAFTCKAAAASFGVGTADHSPGTLAGGGNGPGCFGFTEPLPLA